MRHRFNLLYTVVILTAFLPASLVSSQQLPKSVAIGSNPAGSLFYSLASGMAKVSQRIDADSGAGSTLCGHQHFRAAALVPASLISAWSMPSTWAWYTRDRN